MKKEYHRFTPNSKSGEKTTADADSRVDETYEKSQRIISDTIKKVRSIIEQQMPGFREKVESMIRNKITPNNVIENTLDTLLGCMDMGLGEEEFNMLNQYYSTVNKSGYRFYQREYRKLKKEK